MIKDKDKNVPLFNNSEIKSPKLLHFYSQPFTKEAQQSLYAAVMNLIPVNMMQLIPPLHKYSLHEIEQQLNNFLFDPQQTDFQDYDSSTFNMPFDIDEDFAIATMIRTNTGPFSNDFFDNFSFVFKPCRTMDQINNRYQELRDKDQEELNDICSNFAKKTYEEYLSYKSIKQNDGSTPSFDICTLSKEEPQPISVLPDVNAEINRLVSHRSALFKMSDYFASNDLAVLRNETHEFFIKQSCIIIGKNTNTTTVDIDLSFFMKPGCHHVSKRQALLSFQRYSDRFCFYLENIGQRAFRVNGRLIPKGKVAVLNNGSMIDFSDILFIFVQNDQLIEKLVANFDESDSTKSLNRKKKKI